MNLALLQTLENFLPDVMRCDLYRLKKRVHALKTQFKAKRALDSQQFEQLTADINHSLQRRQQRLLHLPTPQFPEELPISEHRARIAEAIQNHQVIVIAGETGSGKTTQIPKICLSLQRGVSGFIGCTQPRRIAARTIAARVASELETTLGHTVGYKIRFNDKSSEHSYIKFMTDGILLAETQSDKFLENYDTLIIDEAHERSLNIDFLLGYLKQLLPKRPDLKLIIASATIDTQRFSKHFNDAPIVEVSGRAYPVETRYRPLLTDDEDEQDRDMQQAIVDAIDEITAYDRHGDILVFLSGERDIRDTTETLRKHKLLNTEILPLYSRLSIEEQNHVFQASGKRHIVLATNVAETSLTVPRIKAVIDTGLARISRYSVRIKVQRLPIEKIARASADQRQGRCGRIAAGVCIRLYSLEDYLQRPEFTDPEILRTSLASVILQMLALKLGDIGDFPFLDPPSQKMINDGFTLLTELGAVDDMRQLTEIGRQLAKLPIDPRLGRMILQAKQESCLHEVLIIASALSIQDPRERPLDKQDAADLAQMKFTDERSDFLSFLKLWDFLHDNEQHLSKSKLRHLCHEHFLSYVRLLEWQDIHHQLLTLVKEMGWKMNEIGWTSQKKMPESQDFTAMVYDPIHRALLSGLLGNIACKSNEDYYLGCRNIKLYLFPGSGLFKKPPKWLMAAELVETSRLYGRGAAKINVEWVEQLAKNLCHTSYFEPHWEKNSGYVAAYEKVTLYGLVIVPKRKLNYGPLDPQTAREIFIQKALVEGEYHSRDQFFQYNRELVNEIEILEHKARRQDILVDERRIFEFYDAKLPETVYDAPSFEKWRKLAERDNPKILFLQREDLMLPTADKVTDVAFPDHFLINQVPLPLSYHFEPGHDKDGVTVEIPLTLLNQLSPQRFEWLVPGLLEEKITALLRSLPKALRKLFVPVPDVARDALASLDNLPLLRQQSLYEVLYSFLQRKRGEVLPKAIFDLSTLPLHLLINFQLVDAGKVLDSGRDLVALQQKWGTHASQNSQQQIAEISGLASQQSKTWDFGELADQVDLQLNGIAVKGFPTLIDKENWVELQVLDNPTVARQELWKGLRRLFLLNIPSKNLIKQMPINNKLCIQYIKLGTEAQLKVDILAASVDTVFLIEPLPKNAAQFEQRLSEGKKRLLTIANEFAETLSHLLTEFAGVNSQLVKLGDKKFAVLAEVRTHLNSLIYTGFVRHTSLAQLNHFPRYLKAVQVRLDKWERDPAKDEIKSAQLRPLWQAYWQRVQQASEAERLALQEFRWLLEELRVSLFAQELKTACPISLQRLEKLWEKLQ
jgi:ATP-dependent helicase HrpA